MADAPNNPLSRHIAAFKQWFDNQADSLTRATNPLVTQVRAHLPGSRTGEAGSNSSEGLAPGAGLPSFLGAPRVSTEGPGKLLGKTSRPSTGEAGAGKPPLGDGGRRLKEALHNRGGAPKRSSLGGRGATTGEGTAAAPNPTCSSSADTDRIVSSPRTARATINAEVCRTPPPRSASMGGTSSKAGVNVPLLSLNRGVHDETGGNGSPACGKTPRSYRAGPGVGRGMSSSPQALSARGAVSARGSHNFFGQLDEFLHRGTPRAASSSRGVRLPCLEQQLSVWAQAHGLSHRDARLADLREAPSSAGAAVPSVSPSEAVLILQGVEVVIEIVTGPNHGSIVVAARTCCTWPAAKLSVAGAMQAARGMPLESFLDALWAHGPWGNVSEGVQPPACRGSLSAVPACSAAPVTCAPAALPSSRRESSNAEVQHCSSPESNDSSESPPQRRDAPMETTGQPEMQCSEPKMQCGMDSFASWLSARPPLWRFEHSAQGLAWDFPPSKSEKRELLLLHVLAADQEEQKHR
mmetsp:Transcript_82652/g.157509  ORF Transcript_82652/g.157509 Transcript_82652/m.157509 type:complete len:522 (-) Transcript_82652:139-1704(-)